MECPADALATTMPQSRAAAKSTWFAWLPVCTRTRTSESCSSSVRVKRVRSRLAINASKPRNAAGSPNGPVNTRTSARSRNRRTPSVPSHAP